MMHADRMISKKAASEIEEMWQLRREAVRLLGLVVAEWKSDHMSVQCFDLRTVEASKLVIARLDTLSREYDYF